MCTEEAWEKQYGNLKPRNTKLSLQMDYLFDKTAAFLRGPMWSEQKNKNV